jgi:hypothetical protein
MGEQDTFDDLINLHDSIKSFKIETSAKVLQNFCEETYPNVNETKEDECSKFYKQLGLELKLAKFTKIYVEQKKNQPLTNNGRLNLSSSATCAYTLSEYLKMWQELNQKFDKSYFPNVLSYWNYIVLGLQKTQVNELQLTDEFSILNILSVLKSIGEKVISSLEETEPKMDARIIEQLRKKIENDKEAVSQIVKALCDRFIDNQFAFMEKGTHPVIFYKFLLILDAWKPELDKYWKNSLLAKIEEKYNNFRQLKARYDFDDGYHFWFLDELYNKGKYEMYRQISLANANDKSMFDAKKLVYSLLIVRHNGRYQNNLIIDEALRVIFKEQHVTGLLPVGLVINNDFVKKKQSGQKVDFEDRPVSTSPSLSSFECFSDMLSNEYVRQDLKKYYKNFEVPFEWAKKRVRKDSATYDRFLGWYPEYETIHIPESWASAHILLFLKKYCEFLSELLSDKARNSLHAAPALIEKIPLCRTFGIGNYLEEMVQNEDCRSALVFGPSGCSKAIIGQVLAQIMSQKKKNWDYIELTPDMFMVKGQANILPEASEIFKRLCRVRKAVIFFDEVNVFNESSDDKSSAWFIENFLSKFTGLMKHKDVKLIFASSMKRLPDKEKITPEIAFGFDPSLIRLGRVDLVLPMGPTYWWQRVEMLKDAMKKTEDKTDLADVIKKIIENKQPDVSLTKSAVKDKRLANYLYRTDYMTEACITQILEAIFDRDDKKLFDAFFSDEQPDAYQVFEEDNLFQFHRLIAKGGLSDFIRFSPRSTTKDEDIRALMNETIFRTKERKPNHKAEQMSNGRKKGENLRQMSAPKTSTNTLTD